MTTAKSAIRNLGFETTRAFQSAWALGPALTIDGVIGPKTGAAALLSWERHQDGKGDISTHFSAHEFACHCGNQMSGCKGTLVVRRLLRALEAYRDVYTPKGLTIVSGYRCEKYNAKVDGAKGSQHLVGRAADIAAHVQVDVLAHRKWFTGLGYRKSDHRVCHVDVRTAANTSTPTTWQYAQW